jgi:hypothetical protein
VSVARPIGGIWTGGIRCRARNGPMFAATCYACGSELISCPTHEEADAGKFFWEVEPE